MASVHNIGINKDGIKVNNVQSTQPAGMSKDNAPLNKSHSRESYWFVHGRTEDESCGNASSEIKTGVEYNKEREREEKARQFREQQEEGRRRRMRDMEQQFMLAKKHREQQEEERRKKIEEARIREQERRQQVEERKRQIWEAEQERKEAILRRNMDREARIEARRNAQRNSQCFAFGSSTPRTFDLELAAIGLGRSSVLMSSVGRRSEERELGPPRATSACSLDRKTGEDLMTRSMVSLSTSSTFRGKRRTDITPTFTRERSITPHSSRGNFSNGPCSRAVSMTRLDQLAQPRRPYLRQPSPPRTTIGNPSMSKSMFNLANTRSRPPVPPKSGIINSNMSKSMLHLQESSPQEGMGIQRVGMRPARSMVHLAVQPRLTRAARLRAQALAMGRTVSAWNVDKAVESQPALHYLCAGKDASRSPSRPQSSMSGTSEMSASSSSISLGVNLRPRVAPRRPRPYSVIGVVSTSAEKQDKTAPVQKPQRTKSANRDIGDSRNVRPKKPVPPPKSVDIVAKAKSQPVPTKDNLRKVAKPELKKKVSAEEKAPSNDTPDTPNEQPAIPATTESTKTDFQPKPDTTPISEQPKPNSNLNSPMTDSDMPLSSDDSKVGPPPRSENESPSLSESFSELKVLEDQQTIVAAQNIPTNLVADVANSPMQNGMEGSVSYKPRITSEEEARAALAEKRRLAREQAEREAELERQRLKEIRRREEEQRHLDELEQQRMEEEQIRLAELHRKLEEQKLAKAIEEQKRREQEEQEKKDEEARQKAEKEEQEKKTREEAEKLRIELQEKLRKEEEERAERKRRVEQIMARTRGKSAQSQSGDTPPKPLSNSAVSSPVSGTDFTNGVSALMTRSYTEQPLPDLLNGSLNGGMSMSSSFTSRTVSANGDRTNGYSSQEDMSCTTSPEENTDVLINIQQKSSTDFSKLVDLETHDVNNENFLRSDELNSNLKNSNSFMMGFEESHQKPESTVTDLLS